jgi:RNA-directed DNA polymerase
MKAGFNRGKRRAGNREYKMISERIRRRMNHVDALKQADDESAVAAAIQTIATLDQQRKGLSSSDPLDANYRRLTYIRYADDFLIGTIGSREEAKSVMKQVAEFLGDKLRLEIATDKSGVVHASEGVRFLGYDVRTYTGNRIVKTVRSIRNVTARDPSERMQLHIPQKRLLKFCNSKGYGIYDTFDITHRNPLINLSEPEIVQTYNAEMRGLANYYSLAINAKRDLNKLHGIWRGSLLKTLAGKRQSTVVKVARSLKNGTMSALVVPGKGRSHVFPIYDLREMRSKPNTFRSVDLLPVTWQFTLGRTELIQRLNAEQCEYCGDTECLIEVHHIRKMADVLKGKQLWQVMMASRNRKTLVLCFSCHRKLHAGVL